MAKETRKLSGISRLYRASKISRYKFGQLLWHYAWDYSASETARRTGLSTNSATAFYRKTRHFFLELGVFRNILEAPAVRNLNDSDIEVLQAYHAARMSIYRRKVSLEPDDSDLKESCWRLLFELAYLDNELGCADRIAEELLAFIKDCGPIGAKPRNREKALQRQLELSKAFGNKHDLVDRVFYGGRRFRFSRAYVKSISDEMHRTQKDAGKGSDVFIIE